jgi:hypothetical protein
MLALLTVAYGEYAMKKLSVLNGIGSSRKGEKMCKMTHKVGTQKCKGQMQTWIEYELGLKIRCETNIRRIEYE